MKKSRIKNSEQSPTNEVEVVSPTNEVEVVSPTNKVEVVSPTNEVEVVSPTNEVEVMEEAEESNVPTMEELSNSWAQLTGATTAVKTYKKVKTVKTGVGAEILVHIAQGVLSNKAIVEAVCQANPLRKTTYACVAWYRSQVKAGKIDLPEVEAI